MKFAIVGAGAIGGFLGTRLAAAGDEVTFIARGANLAAIKSNGMKLIEEEGSEVIARNVRAFEQPADAGKHDAILLTVKAHQVGAIAAELRHLCDADTAIVTMQNGIPWWYFHNHGGTYAGRAVNAVDPDGNISRLIDASRIIGSVIYPAAVLTAPGVVKVIEGNRLSLGELDGATTPRLKAIAERLINAGFKTPITDDIRGEIWLKLWGNLCFNPISALSHATLVDICQFPPTRELAAKMMAEAEAIANKLGVKFKISIERRIAGAEKVGAHKTSMLQDVEHGRRLELDALLGSVIELGALTQTPTPNISAVYAIVNLLAKTLDTQHGKLQIAH
ncbi:MAG TPA: 2-dehydropantoate 2-reductase [Steroidobacteraceae bacterium]|nr:2-dehydropantoate 2-reductase [Steroidobacteraceae bacterium]